jgi:hypothetical protein
MLQLIEEYSSFCHTGIVRRGSLESRKLRWFLAIWIFLAKKKCNKYL